MSKIQFRLAARTDAAGKYNAEAPLEGNEDNMFVDSDLCNVEQGEFMADKVVDLSDKGCLMVVADGMGGMNAGEVASAIAIKTVMEYFDAQHMAAKSFRDSRSRMNYMEEVVVAADAAIKADANMDKNHEGMGSTIIMAWLCDSEICLTWCGDSRAYLYRPGCGFWQVSKDHSYVQGLVDEGKITPDEAFDHPYGNIITRSLGDPEKKSKADSVNFDVYKGDVFMLCSDGLSGVLRDHKTYVDGQRIESENLEDIIAANRTSMAQCRDELFDAAQRNDWYDNVTAILCEIVSGDPIPADMKPPVQATPQPRLEQSNYAPQAPNPVQSNNIRSSLISIRKKNLPIIIAAIVLLIGGAGYLVWWLMPENKPTDENEFFAYCEKRQRVEDYRAFVKQFPNSSLVPLAQSWINRYEQDSIAQEKKKGEETPQQSGNDDVRGKKEKEKVAKQEKRQPEKPAIPGEELGGILGTEDSDLSKVKVKGEDLNRVGDNVGDNEELTKIGDQADKGGKKGGNNSEEYLYDEVYRKIANNSATIEDCKKYLRKWAETGSGSNAEHWKNVADYFKRQYVKDIQRCKTIDEITTMLNKHDGLMTELHLAGYSEYDLRVKKFIESQKRKLEKEQKNNGNGDRYQPGTQNGPQKSTPVKVSRTPKN